MPTKKTEKMENDNDLNVELVKMVFEGIRADAEMSSSITMLKFNKVNSDYVESIKNAFDYLEGVVYGKSKVKSAEKAFDDFKNELLKGGNMTIKNLQNSRILNRVEKLLNIKFEYGF